MKSRTYTGNFLTYLLSLTAISLWGASYIWSNCLISRGVSIFYFVFVRIAIAGLLLLAFNAASRKFQTIRIPIFSIFAGVVFFREKICGLNIFGIFLSLGGIVLVAMAKGELGEHFIAGVIFLLIAVIAEVCHASITKKLSDHYASQNIVMYQFLIGSVYLLPLFIFKGLEDFDAAVYLSWDTWKPVLCLAVLCSSVAFSLWVGTIKKLGVAKSSIFTALIPVASAIIAWVCGHELLNPRQWFGVALCTVGVILSQVTVKAHAKKAAK